MRIRPAEAGDADRVAELLEELGRPAVGPSERERCASTFARQVEDPDAHHLIAETADGTVAGFVSLHFRERLNQTTPEAWVPDLVVSAGARREGLGRALMEEAERVARERGCHQMTLESGYRRAEAHDLYRRSGLRDVGKAFGKKLA